MYARVTSGQFQPDTLDELMPYFDAAARQQQGMKGFASTRLLIDRAANNYLVVTVFETLADLQTSETVPRQLLADPHVAAALAGRPVVAV